jgi:predicted dehydrogenase
MSPVKIRRTLIGGDRKMVLYDELEPSEKLKVYDCGVEAADQPAGVYERKVGYRTGDMWAPQLSLTEALKVEAAHFIDCVTNRKTPITDGEAGYRVIQILEAASRSMKERGALVEIQS